MRSGHQRGAVRVRSNVVMASTGQGDDSSWDLVPGEIIESLKPHRLSKAGANRRQLAERGYYLKCSYCDRLAHEIGREGCDDARCSRPPSEAEVAAARARHEEALQLIAAEREHLAENEISTESEHAPPVLDAERAIARFLGLEAITQPDPTAEPEPAAHRGGSGRTLAAAKQALTSTAMATGRFSGPYCGLPLDNLVDTLTLGQGRTALLHLQRGDGGELREAGDTAPKFCAAYSSSALAVNCFAAWLGREAELTLAGRTGFSRLEFEVKFPTGLRGNPPNLDVVAFGADGIVAVESKCTEYLTEHEALFPDSYDDAVQQFAHPSWQQLFAQLKGDPRRFAGMDAGQILRHYLGLRRAVADGLAERAVLLYLYWEPSNGDDLDAVRAHRSALDELDRLVADPHVPLIGLPYEALWRDWEDTLSSPWAAAHVAALRARYAVPVA